VINNSNWMVVIDFGTYLQSPHYITWAMLCNNWWKNHLWWIVTCIGKTVAVWVFYYGGSGLESVEEVAIG